MINNTSETQRSSSPTTSIPPPDSIAYVHSFLDEYGLDPYEFRVYAHIVRRTGGKPSGVCFASLSKIATICKMSPRKAQQAIKVLMAANLVTQTKRAGQTDEYRVTIASTWTPREELEELRQKVLKGTKKRKTTSKPEASEKDSSMESPSSKISSKPFSIADS